MKHKFAMINGFKQFSTCHVQREFWCKELHLCTKNCPEVNFSQMLQLWHNSFFCTGKPQRGRGTQFLSKGAAFFYPRSSCTYHFRRMIPGQQLFPCPTYPFWLMVCPFVFCWRLVSSIVFLRYTLSPDSKQSRGDIIFVVWELPQLNVAAICRGPDVTQSISMRGK